MESFRKLGLSESVLKVIKGLSFTAPSEIQERAIPLILEGRDVIGYAATGSGKTLAFGAGIINKVKKGEGIQALIMTPTRELTEQVADAVIQFSKNNKLKIAKVYGGVSITNQINELKTADVVVGTPGRLLDHLQRETLILKDVKVLVLDEADRLVDMGFLPDVEKIIQLCPIRRQTLLFSATSSLDMDYIQKEYMIEHIIVEVIKYVDPSKLRQYFYDVPTNLKFSLLVHLVKEDKSKLVMVFCNTKTNTDIVARNLQRVGINAMAIHGGIGQNKRSAIMKRFHEENIHVLVCTDVAARGLDIKNVSHVYNYDSPKNSKEYIHRVGRTARAGKEGKAISIVAERDYENFRNVYDDSSLKIQQLDLPKLEKIPFFFKSMDRGRSRFRGGPRREGRYGRDNRGHRRFSGPRYGSGGRSRPYSNKPRYCSRDNEDRRPSRGGYGRQQHKPFSRHKRRHGRSRGDY